MPSSYTLRVTVACPEAMIANGNQFALAIGENINDDRTFGPARYEDASGNLYSVASTVAVEHFPAIAGMSLADLVASRSWLNDEEGNSLVDLSAAQAAQAALVVWAPSTDEEGNQTLGPTANPTSLTAVVHPDPAQAVEWLGLSKFQ
jgi:hypothetical protein